MTANNLGQGQARPQPISHDHTPVATSSEVQRPHIETLPACPLCGGKEFSRLTTPGHWIGEEVFGAWRGQLALVRCRSCDLRFTNPRPSQELLERFYQGATYCCHEPAPGADADTNKMKRLVTLLAEWAPRRQPIRLLDFGCGAGDFLAHAAGSGWDVTGYEPGRRGRENCRARGLNVVGRLEDLPPGRFDVVTLNHVFEHLADHRATLDGLRQLLAPEGCLYIQVPNARSLRARLSLPILSKRWGFDERYRAFPIHLTYFQAGTLRRLLEQSGYQVRRILTSGMGLEELLIRPDTGNSAARPPASPPMARRRLWRHFIKTLVYGAGLGEYLGVICQVDSSPGYRG
jgi:SAM-dependent methyltransferase